MTTVLLVVLTFVLTFVVTGMTAAELWKCCPCVDGQPDCAARNRLKAELRQKQKEKV